MRKICVYTSTRADYGLLRNLIRQIHVCRELDLRLLVTGTHLTPGQGMTVSEIIEDGFTPDKMIDIRLEGDSSKDICQSMGVSIHEYGQYFSEKSPDLLVVLGDRFETFCCAASAQVCRIPVAHIQGGETTQGAFDEGFRHCITKLSHIHFPCCGAYRQRIISMGESPEHVHDVGALGVENIRQMTVMDRKMLEESIGFKLDRPFFLVTFHPVTLEENTARRQFAELLSALDEFSEHKIIFTGSNADPGGQDILELQEEYIKKHSNRAMMAISLGYLRYLSAMHLCEAVVGNSSSGIYEAPVLRVPTVNIGDRQKGRIRTRSVIDCPPSKDEIVSALKIAGHELFRSDLMQMVIPFEKQGTAERIMRVIKNVDLTNILKKRFFDVMPVDFVNN